MVRILYIYIYMYICVRTCIHKSQFVCSWKIHPLHSPLSYIFGLPPCGPWLVLATSLREPCWTTSPVAICRDHIKARANLEEGSCQRCKRYRNVDNFWRKCLEAQWWWLCMTKLHCEAGSALKKHWQLCAHTDTCLAAHATCCRIGDIPIGGRKELWWNPNRPIFFRSEELEMCGEVSAQCRICVFVLLLY